ncbi:bifunctional 4-hydroxy-2-oxoglutarate aldolase/2-dehydro-3-deoxy-phosphogluconate aldolase [Flavobacterium sp. ANB]|uniref:bifunctional 4-hydroxy-2-oxoglutarate aldolase/2-dehydro-3-deoxy-phosphogluconate aldolase n=1 Tax=unclassified Flavobacterium TaxID=196869 RepID=UPI0012B6DB67|nr:MULTISPECIES: bifunctional 4-hydroxy-2-oxoglutarate aldolase/2-dehydro-3-deoxy-phosphogluconate aldolase [unclassified Flavobacterium]MBF4516784.1 bifunctional 4-hydroxy-2-oxoglutarate aldolase/2-dehydro-3-deoxy-phosphogluconate aldolase [Flavobacterium sp. ANB]MTD69320.1 bifunctional 4-hydroxy-2-oxoglutarate aldolase/2-dehydro-3-deoxy-phosphogluconate aldolase [Flavobacterium sp. LC2016-13]
MNTISNSIDVIARQGILPLYFNTDETITVDVLRTLYKAGIRAVEYTNRGSEALSNFKKMVAVRNAELPGMLLGIGTIKNLEQAKDFYSAGADFFISPGFVPEVAIFLKSKEVLYAPGCMTPTEIIAAENAGIKLVKLFPGNILGIDFLSSIKDIFPSLVFMTTGGVEATHASIESWFSAGASAVGLGSKLISKKRMEERDYDVIENETKKAIEIIQTIRK